MKVLKKLLLLRKLRKWQCGNGFFQAHESHFDKIVWETTDGKRSIWTRYSPTGPVFFDPPPMLLTDGMMNIGMGCVLEEQIIEKDLKNLNSNLVLKNLFHFKRN